MPLLRNKFQPYFPDPDSPNRYQCGSEQYCWPVQVGDRVLTQFYQTPCNESPIIDPEFDDYTLGSELVTNGDFLTANLNLWEVSSTPLSTTLGVYVYGWTGANPNRIYHQPATYSLGVYQTGVAMVVGKTYTITIDITRIAGSVQVQLGNLTGAVLSNPLDSTGVFTFDLIFNDAVYDWVMIKPTLDYDGYINSISVKEKIYTYWDINSGWQLNDGLACHIDGQIGDLKDISPNYIDANKYYKGLFTLSSYSQGYVEFWISDILAGTVSANGTFTYYVTPTVAGTIKFVPSVDFLGCISNPAVYELKKDYLLEAVNSSGTAFDVSNAIEYYNEFVTIDFKFDDYELADGCYTLNMYDQCIVTSDNLVTNPDFALGFTDWVKNNAGSQYAIVADQLVMNFNPFGIGDTDYITNGDFSGGATGWTLGAGWSIVGGKARHTAGNTATLTQTLTLPAPPLPALGYNFYIGFTVSNWTTGTISVKLGNAAGTTSYTWKGNDRFIQFYNPKASGTIDIIFTPSSTFDGDIDDIKVVKTNHSGIALLYHTAIPTVTPGTYQAEWEIISSTDGNIGAKAYLNGGAPTPNYQTVAGTYSATQNYTLTGGVFYILVNWGKTSVDYIQANYVEGSITLDNMSLKKIEPFEATFESECINYQSNSIPRTKMIVGYCDQNSLGFDFANTGFKLMHRAEIRSLNPNYPSSLDIMKTGRGNDRTVYGELQKYWEVTTDFASETFHDLMAAILICDHVEMGDSEGTVIEYSPLPEEYSPNWNGDGAYSLATATFQVRVKEKGQVFNRHT